MRSIFIAFACIFSVNAALAQKDVLSFDEHNKYIYYQVVDVPGFSADSLARNAAYAIKKLYPKATTGKKDTEGGFYADDKFLTYTTLVKHESGEINYTLNIECKDQKYRYWITGFVFIPYERDRYSNFVPVKAKETPLENIDAKYSKKEASGYLDQAGTFCKQLGENLKLYMTSSRTPKKEEIIKKVVTDKW